MINLPELMVVFYLVFDIPARNLSHTLRCSNFGLPNPTNVIYSLCNKINNRLDIDRKFTLRGILF